jgi:hypothetical protein
MVAFGPTGQKFEVRPSDKFTQGFPGLELDYAKRDFQRGSMVT